MKKTNLTLSELVKTIGELEKSGITVVKPLPNLPVGTYELNFVTQKSGNTIDIVSNVIEYQREGEKRAFPQIMVNAVNTETGEKYQSVGIAFTDEVEKIIKVKANLKNKFDGIVEEGRTRNFLRLAS